ncbi:MAG TPA: hypothetical protein VEQ59_21585, partial [Polyangiaceae bacterium]|nr:hypothetical protein [Polyangiaceae bacterium]
MAELNFSGKTLPVEPVAAAATTPKSAPPREEPAPAPEPTAPEATSAGRKPFFKWLVSSPAGVIGLGLTGVGVGGGIGLAIASKKSYDNADSVAAQITHAASQDSMMQNPNTRDLCNDPSAWLMKQANPPTDISGRASQYDAACSKYQDNVHNGDQLKTWSTVGFVVGGAAAVGTVIFYFVDPGAKESSREARGERRRVTLVPSVGPGQTGLTVIGSF